MVTVGILWELCRACRAVGALSLAQAWRGTPGIPREPPRVVLLSVLSPRARLAQSLRGDRVSTQELCISGSCRGKEEQGRNAERTAFLLGKGILQAKKIMAVPRSFRSGFPGGVLAPRSFCCHLQGRESIVHGDVQKAPCSHVGLLTEEGLWGFPGVGLPRSWAAGGTACPSSSADAQVAGSLQVPLSPCHHPCYLALTRSFPCLDSLCAPLALSC